MSTELVRVPEAEAAVLPKAEVSSLPVKVIDIDSEIRKAADTYGVSYDHLYKTLDCESAHFKSPDVQSGYYKNGVRERSFGFAQINQDSHPDIPLASSTDPIWSINYMAKEFSQGKQEEWSCYHTLSSKNWKD